MGSEPPLLVLWRRRFTVLAVFLAFTAAAALLSARLEPVYSTESTLLVSVAGPEQTFDTVQASQALARSYAEIIASPNLAALVAERLGGDPGPDALLAAMRFDPVPDTQLLAVGAEAESPGAAKRLADTYAQTFIAYAERNLEETTRARVTLADAAPLPADPVRPRPLLYTGLGALLGLALGPALALLREHLDRRLRPEEAEEATDLPVLGRIPKRGRSAGARAAHAEAFRLLRANLEFARKGTLRGTALAVVSSRPGEGRSAVTAHLARAIAETGLEVIVIEADLRRPALARELEAGPAGSPGLGEYLLGEVDVDAVLEPVAPNLQLIRAGRLPANPSVALQSERARFLDARCRKRCDVLIFDTPPLKGAADASIVGSLCDAVLLVVDLRRATGRHVREAVRQLGAVSADVAGLVLNHDDTAAKDAPVRPMRERWRPRGDGAAAARERSRS